MLKKHVYKCLDIIFLSNRLVIAWICVNICSSFPTVFFSHLPHGILKECDCPLANVGPKGTQLLHAGGGAVIGLDVSGVARPGTTKAKQASTHSPSLNEPPTMPSHIPWPGHPASRLEAGTDITCGFPCSGTHA